MILKAEIETADYADYADFHALAKDMARTRRVSRSSVGKTAEVIQSASIREIRGHSHRRIWDDVFDFSDGVPESRAQAGRSSEASWHASTGLQITCFFMKRWSRLPRRRRSR
jgi:hypothetical protein